MAPDVRSRLARLVALGQQRQADSGWKVAGGVFPPGALKYRMYAIYICTDIYIYIYIYIYIEREREREILARLVALGQQRQADSGWKVAGGVCFLGAIIYIY